MTYALAATLMLAACTSQNTPGTGVGTMLGAQVGGMLGGLMGNSDGRDYRGHLLGSIIGTVAGAAIGNALTTPHDEAEESGYDEGFVGVPRSEVEVIRKSSNLVIRQIRFVDYGRDHAINSGESCRLIFEVMNKGNRPVRNVMPVVEEVSGMKKLYISPSVSVESIRPGEGIKYTANIRAGKRIKNGEAIFRVYAVEGNGATSAVKEFALPTVR